MHGPRIGRSHRHVPVTPPAWMPSLRPCAVPSSTAAPASWCQHRHRGQRPGRGHPGSAAHCRVSPGPSSRRCFAARSAARLCTDPQVTTDTRPHARTRPARPQVGRWSARHGSGPCRPRTGPGRRPGTAAPQSPRRRARWRCRRGASGIRTRTPAARSAHNGNRSQLSRSVGVSRSSSEGLVRPPRHEQRATVTAVTAPPETPPPQRYPPGPATTQPPRGPQAAPDGRSQPARARPA